MRWSQVNLFREYFIYTIERFKYQLFLVLLDDILNCMLYMYLY